jgi:hypothetical protein
LSGPAEDEKEERRELQQQASTATRVKTNRTRIQQIEQESEYNK